MRRVLLAAAFMSVVSCGRASPPPVPAPDPLPPAPWSGARLAESDVQPIYLSVWRSAENRASCALIAPARTSAALAGASSRVATFGGGWAVAHDLADLRSAFGVAGTGASAWSGVVYDGWPHRRVFADSSRLGYGLEGGTEPNWLAYVRIPGQDCLYNVWSRRGREHLEALLADLRFVNTR